MNFFDKWMDKYAEKVLKELDKHPEKNKKSSGIVVETLLFLLFVVFFGLIIYFMPTK